VTPFLLIGFGLAALAAGAVVLSSFGRRYRVGRLLATTPRVSVGEALELARGHESRYVRVDGRIDSDQEFEDADHRPLVLRRTRLEVRDRPLRRWRPIESRIEAVPFEIHEGLDGIGVDASELGAGLVVVPRQSAGVVSELGERAPEGVNANVPARLTMEQVSSIEHAIVLGVPALDAEGAPRLSASGGRPVVLTTLEIPEAMRVLTGGDVLRARLATACLLGGGALLVVGLALWAVLLVASPPGGQAATPAASILPGSDTRSAGEGPGLVGDPALAILSVIGIGIVAMIATLAYVRLTSPRPPST
jgi:hypothetical protein